MRNRAFKDPEAAAEKLVAEEHAVESACDFAWADLRVRERVRGWLLEDEGLYLSFELQTHRGITVRAVFRRHTRDVDGRLLLVAVDPLAPKTVYSGMEMPCLVPLAAGMLQAARAS